MTVTVESELVKMIEMFRTDKELEFEASIRMNKTGLPYNIFKMLYDRITELATHAESLLHIDPCIQYIDMYTNSFRTRSRVGHKQETIIDYCERIRGVYWTCLCG